MAASFLGCRKTKRSEKQAQRKTSAMKSKSNESKAHYNQSTAMPAGAGINLCR
jgi:hypothetical protein